MPQYESLVPLLKEQSYIDNAFTIKDWICTGSPYGDQPWEAPVPPNIYDKVYHLTYRTHPNFNQPLIDYIAAQQGITLSGKVCPFITSNSQMGGNYIACAFNGDYPAEKLSFLTLLKSELSAYTFVTTNGNSWELAARIIEKATCFVGDRSSNWVLANGVGQKNIFTYEPHPSRNMYGQYGMTFGNPHWRESSIHFQKFPLDAAEKCISLIKNWLQQKENKDANASA